MWFYSFIFGLFCHIDYILLVHLIIKNDLKKGRGRSREIMGIMKHHL